MAAAGVLAELVLPLRERPRRAARHADGHDDVDDPEDEVPGARRAGRAQVEEQQVQTT